LEYWFMEKEAGSRLASAHSPDPSAHGSMVQQPTNSIFVPWQIYHSPPRGQLSPRSLAIAAVWACGCVVVLRCLPFGVTARVCASPTRAENTVNVQSSPSNHCREIAIRIDQMQVCLIKIVGSGKGKRGLELGTIERIRVMTKGRGKRRVATTEVVYQEKEGTDRKVTILSALTFYLHREPAWEGESSGLSCPVSGPSCHPPIHLRPEPRVSSVPVVTQTGT